MPRRRVLSLWFTRFVADMVVRARAELAEVPLAVTRQDGGQVLIAGVNAIAAGLGVQPGQSLGDARALCPDLTSRTLSSEHAAAVLAGLQRWAERFAPWVAPQGPDALIIDISGSAHLFGGEAALAERIALDCQHFGYAVSVGVADTPGAAWAVARYGPGGASVHGKGDAIDQEARATRSRAVKRGGSRGDVRGRGARMPAPSAEVPGPSMPAIRIVPVGQVRTALAPLPLACLRLEGDAIAALSRLGLRTVGDIASMPRAALARRFGLALSRRLDQAFGAEPEPISPARPLHVFALRLSLPDPIGLEADILAGLDRLLPPLTARLTAAGRGARRVRLTAYRTDGGVQSVEIGITRPTDAADRIRPLLALRIGDIDAGFGIDTLRLAAVVTEPLSPQQHKGPMVGRNGPQTGDADAMAALMNRIGARLGLDALTRLHPADSHIPDKSFLRLAAAYSDPASDWPGPRVSRPLVLFPAEPVSQVTPAQSPGNAPPQAFRWRRRQIDVAYATGPERIAPEWWLDDPAWRSGPRDYWQIEAKDGTRLWLFEAKGAETSGGWFVHGSFA